jgi:hypothetical protein
VHRTASYGRTNGAGQHAASMRPWRGSGKLHGNRYRQAVRRLVVRGLMIWYNNCRGAVTALEPCPPQRRMPVPSPGYTGSSYWRIMHMSASGGRLNVDTKAVAVSGGAQRPVRVAAVKRHRRGVPAARCTPTPRNSTRGPHSRVATQYDLEEAHIGCRPEQYGTPPGQMAQAG